MAKKSERWQGDAFNVDNPFAALSKSAGKANNAHPEHAESATVSADLPVVKSARIERAHRSGKTVTIVSFRDNPDKPQLTAWLKKAKNAFGCGGTIEEDKVVLQGDCVDRVKKERIKNASSPGVAGSY